jgi:hypothetical protein
MDPSFAATLRRCENDAKTTLLLLSRPVLLSPLLLTMLLALIAARFTALSGGKPVPPFKGELVLIEFTVGVVFGSLWYAFSFAGRLIRPGAKERLDKKIQRLQRKLGIPN